MTKSKSRKTAKKKRCRERGDERDHVLHLPVCNSEAARIASDIEDELLFDEADRKPVARGPASTSQSSRDGSITYGQYLNDNANHPALNVRRARRDQSAFVDSRRGGAYAPAATVSVIPPAEGIPPATGIPAPGSTSTGGTNAGSAPGSAAASGGTGSAGGGDRMGGSSESSGSEN